MKPEQFVICYAGKYPVKIVENVAGKVFELVVAERANRYPNKAEAHKKAVDHGIKNFTVEPESILVGK